MLSTLKVGKKRQQSSISNYFNTKKVKLNVAAPTTDTPSKDDQEPTTAESSESESDSEIDENYSETDKHPLDLSAKGESRKCQR